LVVVYTESAYHGAVLGEVEFKPRYGEDFDKHFQGYKPTFDKVRIFTMILATYIAFVCLLLGLLLPRGGGLKVQCDIGRHFHPILEMEGCSVVYKFLLAPSMWFFISFIYLLHVSLSYFMKPIDCFFILRENKIRRNVSNSSFSPGCNINIRLS
jgi:hypothetical protein